MSVSKSYVNSPENREQVVAAYLGRDRPTSEQVALRLGTTYHNVRHILSEDLSPEKLKAEQALRYSRSKIGSANPMQGKSGSLHHNYVGRILDGHGYTQVKVGRKYVLEHRLLMAQALGVKDLPRGWDVHHIDRDKTNNTLENLALVTREGHRRLHRFLPDSSRHPLWVQWVSGTSKSQETTPT
jgi:hypothetical protein